MTASESARPRRRVFWSDARFFLGIVLIVASVAGVWFVVTASRQTTPVLAAASTIVAGQTVEDGDVRTVEVALGTAADAYVAADALQEGAVATRTVAAGELLPRSALGTAEDARSTSVVIRSDADVPASVSAGSVVEVWAAPLLERGAYDTPRVLVADATVVSVTRDDSMIGGGAASLELVIPRADVAATLGAVADQSALSVVPGSGVAP